MNLFFGLSVLKPNFQSTYDVSLSFLDPLKKFALHQHTHTFENGDVCLPFVRPGSYAPEITELPYNEYNYL
jgi:hypothetical protein